MDDISRKREIKIIAGFFTVLAALIGGLFLIGNTLLEYKLKELGATPIVVARDNITSTVGAPIENNSSLKPQSTQSVQSQPEPTKQTSTNPTIPCIDWDSCWEFNDEAHTMTWLGATNGDIGQRGVSLSKLQSGYTAIFSNSLDMKIDICKGTLDGNQVAKDCTPQILNLKPGTHRITSPGNQGGFRVYP